MNMGNLFLYGLVLKAKNQVTVKKGKRNERITRNFRMTYEIVKLVKFNVQLLATDYRQAPVNNSTKV